MTSIYMIFAALATTALAKGSIECNFSEHTGARCSGAVGELLLFHLPYTANTEIKLIKDNKYLILKIFKNQTVTLHEEYVNQYQLFPNRTFKLGNAMKRHSGDYLLEEFGSDGLSLKRVNVHLEIQAPVSKPVVSQVCLSTDQMKVSCSSEGDGVQFILTLDGYSLMQTMIGNVTCHVWNNFIRNETVTHLKSCKDFSSFPVVIVAVIAGFVTLVLLVALCPGILNLRNNPRPTTVNAGYSEEMSEIVYADVRLIQKTRKTRPNSHLNAT